jgi:hypothetical protein
MTASSFLPTFVGGAEGVDDYRLRKFCCETPIPKA